MHIQPLLTVKGADWAVKPLESRRVRPREVPSISKYQHRSLRNIPLNTYRQAG